MKHLTLFEQFINELADRRVQADIAHFRVSYNNHRDTAQAEPIVNIEEEEYLFHIGIDAGMLQMSFQTMTGPFSELTNRGHVMSIVGCWPDILDAFKTAVANDDFIITSILIEPAKSKEKGEVSYDYALSTKRGKLYHYIMNKWLSKTPHTMEEYQDSLEYTLDEPTPLSQFEFHIK